MGPGPSEVCELHVYRDIAAYEGDASLDSDEDGRLDGVYNCP